MKRKIKILSTVTLVFLSLGAFMLAGCAGTPKPPAPAQEKSPAAAPDTRPVVYYTRDLSPDGIKKLYAQVSQNITGRTAIKFHRNNQYTRTPAGVARLKALQQSVPNSALVETTFGGGQREAAEMREHFHSEGIDFCPIDVLNADGGAEWPIAGGRQLKTALVAKNLANYDSLVVYAPWRGDAFPGYGSALTNVGVGLQDGKGRVHGSPLNKEPAFFERMAEAGKAVTDHFGSRIAYITLIENVSVQCDCNMDGTAPITLGLIASTDIVAIDRAALDLVFSGREHQSHSLTEKKGTLLGLYQLEYMEKLGMGNPRYRLAEIK